MPVASHSAELSRCGRPPHVPGLLPLPLVSMSVNELNVSPRWRVIGSSRQVDFAHQRISMFSHQVGFESAIIAVEQSSPCLISGRYANNWCCLQVFKKMTSVRLEDKW